GAAPPDCVEADLRPSPPPPRPATHLWATRQRPKLGRIACPWLIRRVIDPAAEFVFVAPPEVIAVGERFAATPFDVEGVPISHRAERCSFDSLLGDFVLHSERLVPPALVVPAARTRRAHLR